MSSESSNFRIDWQPSRILCGAFAGLGALAGIAIGASALPPVLAGAFAIVLVWRGLRLARAEWRRPARAVVLDAGAEPTVSRCGGAGEAMAEASLWLRGPLTLLAWRDGAGKRQSLLWFADTLPPASRRRLRLQFSGADAAAAA